MSHFIQTMRLTNKRGGARPNSGPKVDILANLIRYAIALNRGVGLHRAGRILDENGHRPERVLGEKLLRELREYAADKDADVWLEGFRQTYIEGRKKRGLKP
jgi:hypothetical protein